MTIFCIGLGKEFQRDQLRDMATDPDSKYVITAEYEELNQVLPNFKKICCEGDFRSQTSHKKHVKTPCFTDGRFQRMAALRNENTLPNLKMQAVMLLLS